MQSNQTSTLRNTPAKARNIRGLRVAHKTQISNAKKTPSLPVAARPMADLNSKAREWPTDQHDSTKKSNPSEQPAETLEYPGCQSLAAARFSERHESVSAMLLIKYT